MRGRFVLSVIVVVCASTLLAKQQLDATIFVSDTEPSGVGVVTGAEWIHSNGTLKIRSGAAWITVTGGGGGAAWGGITGLLSDQTDLQTALDGKSDLGHSHVDADIPNTITIDLAAAATALAANPADCAANQFATTIAASGALTCAALVDADVPNTITVNLAAAATALNANPTDCGGGQFANAIDAAGNLTCATPAGGSGVTVLRVTGDVSQSTTSFADVTGLTTAVTSGTTYVFECRMTYTTAVTTTALQVSVNGPSMTALDYDVITATTATAQHDAVQTAVDTVTNPATGGGSTRLSVRIGGSFIPSANGTFAVRYRSEVGSSSVTVKRGSFCTVS